MNRQVDIKALVSHIVRGDGLDKCRICMGDTTQGQVHLTDTVMMDGDKAVTLSELLEIITGVEVEFEEALPSAICLSCSVSAYEAVEFRALVRKTEQRWTDTVQLLQHLSEHRPAKSSDRIVAIVSSNGINITDEDTKPPPVKKDININPVIKRFGKQQHCKCPTCGKEFLYALLLNKHLKESADLLRACHICAVVMNRNDLVQHLIESHDRKPYACKKCPALFLNAKPYWEHASSAHAPGVRTCGDCSRSFRSLPALHAHQAVHARRACPNCDDKFQNQMCYTHHVKQCCRLESDDADRSKPKLIVKLKNGTVKMGKRGSTNSKCVCDYCQKTFSAKKFVAAHIEIVHTRASHRPCARCGKLFAAAHMAAHLASHAARAFPCAHCGAVLRSQLGFRQHLRLHTGERPYRCEHCGEAFSASSRRSEHVRSKHRNSEIVLKHACHICSARFRLPYKLRQHVRSAHAPVEAGGGGGGGGERPEWYRCTHCDQSFPSCRSLLIHSKKHYANAIDTDA